MKDYPNDETILSQELIRDKSFLINYINILKKKKIPSFDILERLTQIDEYRQVIKADVELLQTVFEKIEPNNLKKFFDKFVFSTD